MLLLLSFSKPVSVIKILSAIVNGRDVQRATRYNKKYIFPTCLRALCNGKTSAFQADDAGSIPAARLFKSCINEFDLLQIFGFLIPLSKDNYFQ